MKGSKGEIMLFLTLGAGVGGAYVKDGKVIFGADGMLGHRTLVQGGIKCNCGRRGRVEKYASGSAFRRLLAEKGVLYHTSEEIWAAYMRGEAPVRECVEKWAEYVNAALKMYDLFMLFDRAVLGGGMSAAGKNWIGLVHSGKYAVATAKAGDDAGLIGAYVHFMQKYCRGEQAL